MPAPKEPQDHKKKSEKPKVETVEGGKAVTIRGITVTILDETLDDFELVEELSNVQFGDKADQARLPLILKKLVGDQYQAVMDGLRAENGRVPVADGFAYITELFKALNPNS